MDNPVNNKADKNKRIKNKHMKENKLLSFLKTNRIIYTFIILLCLFGIVYSSINIYIWYRNNVDNEKMIQDVIEKINISSTEDIEVSPNVTVEKKTYDFSSLISQNPDTVGWIEVPNTKINYPVVQAKDNSYYLDHSFDKSKNNAGWIYADYRNKFDETDKNIIIYGHNRLNANMFGTLENVLSSDWLSIEENHYITFSIKGETHIYKIFSTFIKHTSKVSDYLKTDFKTTQEYVSYINDLKKLSTYNFDTDPLNEADNIITLYTCHGLSGDRLLVCAKLIK